LAALLPHARRAIWGFAIASSVLVDLDHLPSEVIDSNAWMNGVQRPYGHSLLTVLILFASFLVSRRIILAATAMGVVLHFARDIATGPGLPLTWPVSDTMVRVPYALYSTGLTLAAIIVALHFRRGHPTSTR
jgi:inner membrane protein